MGAVAIRFDEIDSPLGRLMVLHGPRGVCAIGFGGRAPDGSHRRPVPGLAPALATYFAGGGLVWDGEIDLHGTRFQRAVWAAIRQVPAGTVVTYEGLARRLSIPGAARAVGAACGANPVPILVPCHRVVLATGGLGGYSSGIDIKRRLLAIEGVVVPKKTLARGPFRACPVSARC